MMSDRKALEIRWLRTFFRETGDYSDRVRGGPRIKSGASYSPRELQGGPGMKGGKTKGAIGLVGLGIMGGAYARNLIAAGWRAIGFDTNTARRKEAVAAGVKVVENARAVAREVPIIITSLPTPAALEIT